jgi:hypothetical protein
MLRFYHRINPTKHGLQFMQTHRDKRSPPCIGTSVVDPDPELFGQVGSESGSGIVVSDP